MPAINRIRASQIFMIRSSLVVCVHYSLGIFKGLIIVRHSSIGETKTNQRKGGILAGRNTLVNDYRYEHMILFELQFLGQTLHLESVQVKDRSPLSRMFSRTSKSSKHSLELQVSQ